MTRGLNIILLSITLYYTQPDFVHFYLFYEHFIFHVPPLTRFSKQSLSLYCKAGQI